MGCHRDDGESIGYFTILNSECVECVVRVLCFVGFVAGNASFVVDRVYFPLKNLA